MRDLQSIATFTTVAREESFAGAARRLGISTTAASRRVAELEQALGVRLLQRTTRRVKVTEAGARYLRRAEVILSEIDTLHAELSAADQAPRGALRVAAPPGIGHDWIVPLVIDFLAANPAISLELDLGERLVDLVAEGYDAAIRSGDLQDSSLIAHRIAEIRYRLCASPAYLARHGVPGAPADLASHACLYWCSGSTRTAAWTFLRQGQPETIPITCRLRIGSLPALRRAALLGLGLAMLPERDTEDDLARGNLVHVFAEYEIPPERLSLARPATPFEPARLRLFIDFITTALRRGAPNAAK